MSLESLIPVSEEVLLNDLKPKQALGKKLKFIPNKRVSQPWKIQV